MLRRSLFASVTLLLLVAVTIVVLGGTRPLPRSFYGRLIDSLPDAPSGWARTQRPVADTPEMQKKTDELLNFDDVAFVSYTRGSDRLSVYIAYWTPGRMSHRLVAAHTPDVCWVGAGWQCTARSKATPKVSESNFDALPAESRTFVAQGKKEYVWFWHIVGGQPISYGAAIPPWYAGITDLLSKGLDQREEQFFIRISSSTQLEDPALKPVRDPVLLSIKNLNAKRL